MLEKFRAAKQREVHALAKLEKQGRLPEPFAGFRPSFAMALLAAKPFAVIAEYKRASPSKGVIRLDLGPEDVAGAYASGGAAALSVLTEEDHFRGEIGFLARMTGPGLPLLRKDFLLDPLQVAQTAATPASALLLIARMLDEHMLAGMQERTILAGMEAVVEVFDQADLDKARASGARIIQVNNRDLDTLAVDLEVSKRLAAERDPAETWISASGILKPADLARVRDWGYNAALVGTSLMAQGDPGHNLTILVDDLREACA